MTALGALCALWTVLFDAVCAGSACFVKQRVTCGDAGRAGAEETIFVEASLQVVALFAMGSALLAIARLASASTLEQGAARLVGLLPRLQLVGLALSQAGHHLRAR